MRMLGWFVVSCVALALVGAAAAAFMPGEPQCVRTEAPRPLGNAADDRAHLDADLHDIEAIAAAFSAEVARRPRISDSIDAKAGAEVAPARARVWCETVLEDQLAAVHGLSIPWLRGYAADRKGTPAR